MRFCRQLVGQSFADTGRSPFSLSLSPLVVSSFVFRIENRVFELLDEHCTMRKKRKKKIHTRIIILSPSFFFPFFFSFFFIFLRVEFLSPSLFFLLSSFFFYSSIVPPDLFSSFLFLD